MYDEALALARKYNSQSSNAVESFTFSIEGERSSIIVTVGIVENNVLEEAIKSLRANYIRAVPKSGAGPNCPTCGGTGKVYR